MGLFLSCGENFSVSHVGKGISGTFLSCLNGVKYPFVFPEGTWGFSGDTALEKGLISHWENLVFFSRCGRKLGVPIKLQRGPQGPLHVASEKSVLFSSCEGHVGIPLESLPATRAMFRVRVGNSVILLGGDRDLGLLSRVK